MNLPSTSPQDRNTSVDTFRLLAALCVIVLHLEFPALPNGFSNGLRLLSRWAIPFFFIVSGYYFAAQNNGIKKPNSLKTIGRLIWIFLLWSLIYLPMVLYQHDLKTVLQRFFSPDFIYLGDFFHLWFISSLIAGYLYISFCDQFNLKYFLFFSSVAFVILALISEAYPIFNNASILSFNTARHWLSVPFLCIGIYLYKKGYPSAWISLALIILGAAAQMLEARFIYRQFGISAYEHEFLIGTIPFAVGMAGLALNNLKWLQSSILGNWGRDFSLGIYLSHIIVIQLVTTLISSLLPGILATRLWQLSMPVIALGSCILLLGAIRHWLPGLFNFLYGKHDIPPQIG